MLGATLAIGGHYVVDLIGGALVWAGWYTVSLQLVRREQTRSRAQNQPLCVKA